MFLFLPRKGFYFAKPRLFCPNWHKDATGPRCRSIRGNEARSVEKPPYLFLQSS
jgi:hypothetical protein